MFDATYALQAFVTLFVIVDPIGAVPVFLGLLAGFRRRDRVAMVRRAVVIACAVLLLFTVFGEMIFGFLGISMYSFRLAGGILLLIVSIEMLFGSKTRTELSEDMLAERKDDLTVSPMAVPLLTGPGAITSGIMLYDGAPSVADKAVLCVIVVVVFAISYLILRKSEGVYRVLGKTGTKVVLRLMGILLSAIAVQFMVEGVRGAFPNLV
jgi:multiple antibiotic resistance protein